MIIRRAVTADVATIMRWRQETARWLASQGSDQWSDAGLADDAFLARVDSSVEAGETWIAELAGQPVGTAAIDQWADAGLWTASELGEALVLHRMIVPRQFSGQHIGTALLDQADRLALAAGLQWLRLDAWTNNKSLHAYYRSQGFQLVRTVTGKVSGALFERPVTPRPSHHDDIRMTTTTRQSRTPDPDADDRGNPEPPPYFEMVDDLVLDHHPIRTPGRGVAALAPDETVSIHWLDGEWRWDSCLGWGSHYADTIVAWPAGLVLDPAQTYTLQERHHRVHLALQAALTSQ